MHPANPPCMAPDQPHHKPGQARPSAEGPNGDPRVEKLVTLTQAQIARVFQKWNQDATDGNWPRVYPQNEEDHHEQAATFVAYSEAIAAEL